MARLPIDYLDLNADDFALTNNIRKIQDCCIDSGSIYSRPGLKPAFDLSTIDSKYANYPIDMVYWFSEINSLIVACAGDIISFTDSNFSYSILGSSLLNKRIKVNNCKVADASNSLATTLFMANDSNIVYTTGTSASALSGANIPTRVSALASLDTYLICNDLNNKISWKTSDPTTPKTFSSEFIYSAQANTDLVKTLIQNKNLIWVFGNESLEPFYDSGGDVPFLRIDGGAIDAGLPSEYAITKKNNTIYFLDNFRNIVRIQGGEYSITNLSAPIKKRLSELASTNDVEAEAISTPSGRDFILFNFNDAKTTIVYDPLIGCFYEWGFFDETTGEYSQYIGRCYAYSPLWNKHMIGDRRKGMLYYIDDNYNTDNGNKIRSEIITGIYAMESPTKGKSFSNMFFNFRKGIGSNADKYASVKVYVQFRDDYNQAWGTKYEVNLGSIGQTSITGADTFRGSFRTRQIRITFMDDSRLVLNGIFYEN